MRRRLLSSMEMEVLDESGPEKLDPPGKTAL